MKREREGGGEGRGFNCELISKFSCSFYAYFLVRNFICASMNIQVYIEHVHDVLCSFAVEVRLLDSFSSSQLRMS